MRDGAGAGSAVCLHASVHLRTKTFNTSTRSDAVSQCRLPAVLVTPLDFARVADGRQQVRHREGLRADTPCTIDDIHLRNLRYPKP
jgi:hypothetical protein